MSNEFKILKPYPRWVAMRHDRDGLIVLQSGEYKRGEFVPTSPLGIKLTTGEVAKLARFAGVDSVCGELLALCVEARNKLNQIVVEYFDPTTLVFSGLRILDFITRLEEAVKRIERNGK